MKRYARGERKRTTETDAMHGAQTRTRLIDIRNVSYQWTRDRERVAKNYIRRAWSFGSRVSRCGCRKKSVDPDRHSTAAASCRVRLHRGTVNRPLVSTSNGYGAREEKITEKWTRLRCRQER